MKRAYLLCTISLSNVHCPSLSSNLSLKVVFLFQNFFGYHCSKIHFAKRIEYILEWNLLKKQCKTAILLYCFHTAGVLHIFMLYNLLVTGISFYRKSKIIIKRKPNYKIGWFHNWPMIISHRLYAFHFTNDDFPL